jgi:hypothetical protein
MWLNLIERQYGTYSSLCQSANCAQVNSGRDTRSQFSDRTKRPKSGLMPVIFLLYSTVDCL